MDGHGRQETGTDCFCKVIAMCSVRSFLLVLILVVGGAQVGRCQDKPAVPAEKAPAAAAQLNTELKVYKEALFQQGSVDAATLMLFHDDPNARAVLLDALRQKENSAARIAVCGALIRAREQRKSIKNDRDLIKPLLALLASDTAAEADAAVKATLVFDYAKIGPPLEDIIKDSSKSFRTRATAIRALKLRRGMEPTIRLIELIDELGKNDTQVSTEAKRALSDLGITVAETPEARKKNIEEIKREGEGDFLRAQLTQQDAQVRQRQAELDVWQKRYLSELDKAYKQLTEDKAKSDFLIEYLHDKEAVVRLWALDKAYKWRLASQLSDTLGPVLISLIPDPDRNVRLSTAELLALMQRLNSAQPLLDQHQVEKDDQVRTKLFVALGAACSSALAGPPADIPATIKKIRSITLGLAAKEYLASEDDEKVRDAAEVIRKLLVRDGLKAAEVDKYLKLLSAKYQQEKGKHGGALRGVLLNAMASLCAPESTCKERAQVLFEPLFTEALQDKTDFVREAAVNGLAHINVRKALGLLRAGFYNDPSEALRKKLIALAEEAGGEQDLSPLAGKIGMNSEGDLAWQAMLSIFRRLKETDLSVWKEWIGKLMPDGSKLSNEQRIAFLKIAEGKTAGAIKLEVRSRLAELYYKTEQYEQAAEYFSMLYDAAGNRKDKEAVVPRLLEASLKGLQLKRVAGLVGNHLSQGDLDPNGVIIRLLSAYLGKPPLGTRQQAVLDALEQIKVPSDRPTWRQWLDEWKALPSKEEKPDKTKAAAG
jgi:HEAT repeat protein